MLPRLARTAVVALALLLPAAASAAPPPLGALTPLTGPGACLTAYARPDCSPATVAGTKAVAVAPDGTSAYVVSAGALRAFSRAADGRLTELAGDGACVGDVGTGCGAVIDRFSDAQDLVIAPDGRFLYVTLRDADIVHVIARDPANGRLTPVTRTGGCVADTSRASCDQRVPQLLNPAELAFSPDGRFLFVSAFNATSIRSFARDAATGRITPLDGPGACVQATGADGCAAVPGAERFWGMALTPDGRHLYSASRDADAIFGFDLDPATGRLTPMSGAARCVQDGSGFAPGDVCVRTMPGLREPYAVEAPHGGASLIAVGAASASVVSLRVGADGGLSAGSCLTGAGVSTGCPLFSGALDGAFTLAMSPDRRTALVPARNAHVVRVVGAGAESLAEHPGPGRCVADVGRPDQCATTVDELQVPDFAAFAPDGASAYVHSGGGGESLRTFRIEAAPVCAPAPASAAPADRRSGALMCSDANGDPVAHALVQPPQHGVAVVAASGAWSYTPEPGFSGIDPFTVTATDGTNTSLPATVDAVVASTPPTPPAPGGGGASPAPAPRPTTPPPAPPTLAPGRLSLTARTIALRGSRALVPLACGAGSKGCAERVVLTASVRRKGTRRTTTVTIAAATVGLPAGRRVAVPLPLTQAGTAALKGRRRLTVKVVAGPARRALATKATLARPAPKRGRGS